MILSVEGFHSVPLQDGLPPKRQEDVALLSSACFPANVWLVVIFVTFIFMKKSFFHPHLLRSVKQERILTAFPHILALLWMLTAIYLETKKKLISPLMLTCFSDPSPEESQPFFFSKSLKLLQRWWPSAIDLGFSSPSPFQWDSGVQASRKRSLWSSEGRSSPEAPDVWVVVLEDKVMTQTQSGCWLLEAFLQNLHLLSLFFPPWGDS